MRPIKETDIRQLHSQIAARRKKGAKVEDLAHWLYTQYGLTEPDGSPLTAKRVHQLMQRTGALKTAATGGAQRGGRARASAAPARASRASSGPGWGMYALGIVGLLVAVGLLIVLQRIG